MPWLGCGPYISRCVCVWRVWVSRAVLVNGQMYFGSTASLCTISLAVISEQSSRHDTKEVSEWRERERERERRFGEEQVTNEAQFEGFCNAHIVVRMEVTGERRKLVGKVGTTGEGSKEEQT